MKTTDGEEYNYELQCWTKDGVILRCGHPEEMDCGCIGKEHEGQKVEDVIKEIIKC